MGSMEPDRFSENTNDFAMFRFQRVHTCSAILINNHHTPFQEKPPDVIRHHTSQVYNTVNTLLLPNTTPENVRSSGSRVGVQHNNN